MLQSVAVCCSMRMLMLTEYAPLSIWMGHVATAHICVTWQFFTTLRNDWRVWLTHRTKCCDTRRHTQYTRNTIQYNHSCHTHKLLFTSVWLTHRTKCCNMHENCFFHICDVTHAWNECCNVLKKENIVHPTNKRHDAFIYGTWRIHMCDMTFIRVTCVCVTHAWAECGNVHKTCPQLWHGSFARVTWKIVDMLLNY